MVKISGTEGADPGAGGGNVAVKRQRRDAMLCGA